jgi:hypothetical protein
VLLVSHAHVQACTLLLLPPVLPLLSLINLCRIPVSVGTQAPAPLAPVAAPRACCVACRRLIVVAAGRLLLLLLEVQTIVWHVVLAQ